MTDELTNLSNSQQDFRQKRVYTLYKHGCEDDEYVIVVIHRRY